MTTTNNIINQKVESIYPGIKEMPIKELFKSVDYPAVLLTASRRTGKTHLLHYLLQQSKKKYDVIKLISSTYEHNEGYPYIKKEDKHHTRELPKIVEEYKKKNSDLRKKNKPMISVMLLLDDILDDPIISKKTGNNRLVELTTLGRHLAIGFICLTQYFRALPRVCRGNFDLCLISRTGNLQDALGFVEEYMSGDKEGLTEKGGKSRVPLELYYRIVGEDFNWLCCHTTKQNKNGYSDYIYKVKAESKLKKFNPYGVKKNNRKSMFLFEEDDDDYFNEASMITAPPLRKFNKREFREMFKNNF